MTAIIILNIVFAVFVVGGILAILRHGVRLERRELLVQDTQNHLRRVRPARTVRRASTAGGSFQHVSELG